jgi:hypothetical protein
MTHGKNTLAATKKCNATRGRVNRYDATSISLLTNEKAISIFTRQFDRIWIQCLHVGKVQQYYLV